MTIRHFLTLHDLSGDEFRQLLDRAIELKSWQQEKRIFEPLKNQVLGMVFEKSSTRTRVSFETGMIQFGGQAIFLSPDHSQVGRGEEIADTARVLSNMVDGIMVRTFEHEKVEEFASYASVPVINGLTDTYHPCQLLADMQTYQEHRGSIQGKTVTWVGDGNNMCHSYINAAMLLDFKLHIASPEGYLPDPEIVKKAGDRVTMFSSAVEAAKDVDLIVTDVWASMGQEEEAKERARIFAPYQVNSEMMGQAKSDALFMHCLPAHRGEEVTADVIDSAQSVVWDEAGNRLHAQKALLEFLMAD